MNEIVNDHDFPKLSGGLTKGGLDNVEYGTNIHLVRINIQYYSGKADFYITLICSKSTLHAFYFYSLVSLLKIKILTVKVLIYQINIEFKYSICFY